MNPQEQLEELKKDVLRLQQMRDETTAKIKETNQAIRQLQKVVEQLEAIKIPSHAKD